jgi:hypothetical protein
MVNKPLVPVVKRHRLATVDPVTGESGMHY